MITYGMVSVDLESEGGEKLQLLPGKEAVLNMSITESLVASAPPSIPMWHFDEIIGAWIEEGVGTKQGSIYIGKVSHFSTWNFDVPANFVELSMQVIQPKIGFVPYAKVTVYDALNRASNNSARTDSSGKVKMWAPKGARLLISIAGGCNQVLDSTVFGPFQVNTDLGEVAIQRSSVITVSGTLLDCNSAPVTRGIISLLFEGLTYPAFTQDDGRFKLQIDKCSLNGEAPAVLTGYDQIQMKETESRNITVKLGNNEVGETIACSDNQNAPAGIEFFTFRIGAQAYNFVSPKDSTFLTLFDNQALVVAFDPSDFVNGVYNTVLNLTLFDSIVGSSIYPANHAIRNDDGVIYSMGFHFDKGEQKFRVPLRDTVFLNTLKFEGIGGIVHAKFKTTVVLHGGTGERLPVEGEFVVKRTN